MLDKDLFDKKIEQSIEKFAERVKDWDKTDLLSQKEEIELKINELELDINFNRKLIQKFKNYPKKRRQFLKYNFENDYDLRKLDCEKNIMEFRQTIRQHEIAILFYTAQIMYLNDLLKE